MSEEALIFQGELKPFYLVCQKEMWRVTYDNSPWGIQSWDSRTAAEGQVEALNRVLPDIKHFVQEVICGVNTHNGQELCVRHDYERL